MEGFHNLLHRHIKRENSGDLTKITDIIKPLIYKTVNEVFTSYKLNLLTEPIDYIVPAVWGAKKDGELDATQKEIYGQFIPILKRLFDLLHLKDLSAPQEFTISFLIRELFIAKITYTIELAKNMMISTMNTTEQQSDLLNQNDILNHLDPLGNA